MTKKLLFCVLVLLVLTHLHLKPTGIAFAASIRDIVINEVAWAGSSDNTADEWLELYNPTNNMIDLTGWTIEDDNGAQTYNLSGLIAAHGYYLIESREIATAIPADLVKTLSLSNAGDSLVLKDANGTMIDSVNEASAAWPAGNNTTHATMERVNVTTEGNNSNNWQTSSGGITILASNGSNIIGTPKAINSNNHGSNQQQVSTNLLTTSNSVSHGEEITITASVENVSDLSNYEFDLHYDPNKLRYLHSSEGSFLNANATIETSFQSGLQNDLEGLLVIAGARTITPLTGISGNGNLFSATFAVLPTASTGNTEITIDTQSFLSTPTTHLSIVSWPSLAISVIGNNVIEPVTGLVVQAGSERYSIYLQWNGSATTGVHYLVYRRNTHQVYELLTTTTETQFTDSDSVAHGGNIVPGITYSYQVIVEKDSLRSQPIAITAEESRGLKGDNNRTDRVDGGDLESIARLWTLDDSDTSFAPKVDTSFDGTINGSDLIDLAVNWAKTYP